MTAVSTVSGNSSVTSLLASSKGDAMAKTMAFLALRYQDVQDDLQTQLQDMQAQMDTKRLWNQQLTNLNKLMQDPAFQGKKTSDSVDLYVAPGDLPYKDFQVTKDDDGTMHLTPTSEDAKNVVGADRYTPIYGAPGTDPKDADAAMKTLEARAAALSSPTHAHTAAELKELATVQAQITAARQNVVGYKISVSIDQLKTQTDTVRAQIDSVNTDSQIGMLRLNDTFGKGNLALEQMSKLLGGSKDTADKILGNFR